MDDENRQIIEMAKQHTPELFDAGICDLTLIENLMSTDGRLPARWQIRKALEPLGFRPIPTAWRPNVTLKGHRQYHRGWAKPDLPREFVQEAIRTAVEKAERAIQCQPL